MSLRRVTYGLVRRRGILFERWDFHYSKHKGFTLTKRQYRLACDARERFGAAEIGIDGDRVLWWTDVGLFWADAELSADDVALLVWDRQRRQSARLERLRAEREIKHVARSEP